MILSAGTRLGPYEILEPIGAGGMGEVYRARDSRLDRLVAIKVLSLDSSASPEARQRFEREARTISKLSHPHICQIHDVGNEQGSPFLVMELLEGDTLAARLTKGPLPLETTIRYAMQMAEALEAAHRVGIVHRDVKPANVMLPKSGLKLLDFGLAKDAPVAASGATVTAHAITAPGMAAGTVQYMAPEVLEGHPADRRSDIYALGAVMYEMATGRRVFDGGRVALAPQSFDRIVSGCLARDPDDRWQSARDVQLLLADVRNESASPVAAERTAGRAVAAVGWVVALVATALAVFLFVRPRLRIDAVPAPLIRFAIPPPAGGAFWDNLENVTFALAPDGSQVAYIATDADRVTRVWLRSLAETEARVIGGSDGASAVLWSPESRSIAFFSNGKLKRVDLPDGAAVTVCDYRGSGMSGTWGREGQILFASVTGEAIYRVASSGGTPVAELKPDLAKGERRTTFPWFLPDGRRFVFTARLVDGGRIMLGETGKPPRLVIDAVSNAQYVEPGYLLFARDGTLVAQRFDAATATVSGAPQSIGAVRYFYSTAAARFSTALNGALVYHASFDRERLVWVDRDGREVGNVGDVGIYGGLRISPDGKRVLFSRAQQQLQTGDLWVTDLDRGTEQRLTSDPTSEVAGIWQTDGRSIFFAADRGGPPHLFRKDLRTGDETELMPPAPRLQMPDDVTPDGKLLAYYERTGSDVDQWTLPTAGGPPAVLRRTRFSESQSRFSPDGRAFAFTSDEAGRYDVYLSPYPPTGEKVLVSLAGGVYPRWGRDGRELFYLAPDRRLTVVPIRSAGTLQIGQPVSLFTVPGRRNWKDYDVSVDSKRFLAVVTDVLGDEQPLTAVSNWQRGASR